MKKIALIEDDNVLSKVVAEELSDSGFSVVKAADGEAGINLIRNEKPDLVLLDILMPKKNGYQVLEEIKQSPLTRHIPVIILTMLSVDDDIKKGLKLGTSDYIVKSQHAVSEIVEKVNNFFTGGAPRTDIFVHSPTIDTNTDITRESLEKMATEQENIETKAEASGVEHEEGKS